MGPGGRHGASASRSLQVGELLMAIVSHRHKGQKFEQGFLPKCQHGESKATCHEHRTTRDLKKRPKKGVK